MKSLRVVCKAVLSTLVGAALIFFAVYVRADTTLELKNDFIEKFKNRATIDATYTPKFAHSKPKTRHPASRRTMATFIFPARLLR